MATKQILNSSTAPDGSQYVTLTDGAGNLVTAGGASGITIGTTTITGGADTQVLFNNAGVVGSDAGFTKVAGATGLISVNNGGASTPQFTFTPNSGTTSSLGMANAGSQLLIFVGATQAWGFRANAITAVTGGVINWSTSGSTVTTTTDTSLSRNAAGVLQIGTTAINALGSLILTNFSSSGVINDTGYDYQTPATGGTVTLSNTKYHTIIDPAGTLATLTVNMPSTPTDGMIVDVRFSQIVTTLTVSGNGHSILGNPSSAAVGSQFTAIYRLANTTWYI